MFTSVVRGIMDAQRRYRTEKRGELPGRGSNYDWVLKESVEGGIGPSIHGEAGTTKRSGCKRKLEVVLHIWKLSSWEMEERPSGVRGHPYLRNGFLGYIRRCLTKTNTNTQTKTTDKRLEKLANYCEKLESWAERKKADSRDIGTWLARGRHEVGMYVGARGVGVGGTAASGPLPIYQSHL